MSTCACVCLEPHIFEDAQHSTADANLADTCLVASQNPFRPDVTKFGWRANLGFLSVHVVATLQTSHNGPSNRHPVSRFLLEV